MAVNRKRLVYFERWFDPIAADILNEQEDIELVRLEYAAPEAENWEVMAGTIGYQLGARTELVEPWFGSADLIARCPKLLACSSIGAGHDVIDVTACTEAGIIVCNQSGTNSEAVAEHALGLMLSLSKKIALSNRALLRGGAPDRFDYVGNDIRYKTVGIVGIGNIGRRMAQICRALDMEVLAYDPYLSAAEILSRGAVKVELEELLKRADFVLIHCPRTEETIGMFGPDEFARMKRTAYFINTARGKVHQEPALHAALVEGRIAGAGLDVFDEEPPPPDHPLLALDNVVATPHHAGTTVEANYNMSVAAAEQWMMILRGGVPPRLVNPEAWPNYCDRFESLIGFRPTALPVTDSANGISRGQPAAVIPEK